MTLYEDPDNRFVAGFIGSPRMNFLPARVMGRGDAGEAVVSVPGLGGLAVRAMPRNPAVPLPEQVILGVRPEHIRADQPPGGVPISFRVEAVEQFGNVSLLHASAEGSDGLVAEWRGPGRPAAGDTLPLFLDTARCMLFDPAGPRL